MRLPEGFVVGGRYRIEGLVAAGSKFRVYAAVSDDEDGPGQVAVKVARHDDVESLAGLEFGRSRVQAEWDALMRFHEKATSAAPLPIELVHMYPGDPDVRRVALLDKKAVRHEPYLVCEFADGTPLSGVAPGGADGRGAGDADRAPRRAARSRRARGGRGHRGLLAVELHRRPRRART